MILCSVGLNGSRPGKVNGYTVARLLQSKLHLCLQAIEIEELVIAQRGFPKGDLYILFIACGAAGITNGENMYL